MVENELNLKKQYQELIRQINEHNDYYYNEDAPKITDFEYDQLTQELLEIERVHPKSRRKSKETSRCISTSSGSNVKFARCLFERSCS